MKLEEAIKSAKFKNEKHKAVLNLLYTSYWLKTNFIAAIKQNNITLEQFNILRILNGKYPNQISVKEAAARMLETNSNVPRIIDRLVLKKLVIRTVSPKDKRSSLISLTDNGLITIRNAIIVIDQLIEKELGTMEDDTATYLNDLLEKTRSR